MDVAFINPFITSAISTFSSMLGCELTRGDIALVDSFRPNYDVSGAIGLTGVVTGTVILSLEREVAIAATEKLTGEAPLSIDEDVVDAAGELTNIIAGGAKAKLAEYSLKLALPTVIVGKNHVVSFGRNVRPISIPFSCDWGQISLQVGFEGNGKLAGGSQATASSEKAAAETPELVSN